MRPEAPRAPAGGPRSIDGLQVRLGCRNGKLLAEAGSKFDALLTVDQNLRHQQDAGELRIPVIVLVARTTRLEDLSPLLPSVLRLLGTKLDRRVYVIDA